MKLYEIEVRRTLVNTFTLTARSSAEAAAALGVDLATNPGQTWAHSIEVETNRAMKAPKIVPEQPAALDLRPASLGFTEDRTPEQLATDGDA